MPSAMTYNSLVADVQNYAERTNDSVFNAQIPRLIMLGENRIIAELKNIAELFPVTGTLQIGAPTLPKPAYWRETVSLNITANNQRVPILPRLYEYCRNFWPNPASTKQPRFYADYDANNFLIVPTPDQAYPFELIYFGRVTPLDASNQTNWFTFNAPQLLFYAVMMEAQTYLKNWDQVESWTTQYNRVISALTHEEERKVGDRTTNQKGE